LEANDESNGSWEEEAEEKGRRREVIWIESDCARSNVGDQPSNPLDQA
jgi:hypothetical protein